MTGSGETNDTSGGFGWFNAALVTLFLAVALMPAMTGMAVAQDCENPSGEEEQSQCDLQQTMKDVGNFLSIIIAAVAIPNGAFGIFQWMTAGTDTEQSDKGRKRIRNSFIGVAGAGVVVVAVELLIAMVGV